MGDGKLYKRSEVVPGQIRQLEVEVATLKLQLSEAKEAGSIVHAALNRASEELEHANRLVDELKKAWRTCHSDCGETFHKAYCPWEKHFSERPVCAHQPMLVPARGETVCMKCNETLTEKRKSTGCDCGATLAFPAHQPGCPLGGPYEVSE